MICTGGDVTFTGGDVTSKGGLPPEGMCAFMRACVCVRVGLCVRACVCLLARARALVCWSVNACVRACARARAHVRACLRARDKGEASQEGGGGLRGAVAGCARQPLQSPCLSLAASLTARDRQRGRDSDSEEDLLGPSPPRSARWKGRLGFRARLPAGAGCSGDIDPGRSPKSPVLAESRESRAGRESGIPGREPAESREESREEFREDRTRRRQGGRASA